MTINGANSGQPVKRKEKLTPRGRLTGSENSEFNSILNSTDSERVREFTLQSGKKIRFQKRIIFGGDIETKTFVNPIVNPRVQSLLTPESLWDILQTIGNQQYFPVIGRMVDGRIEVLDGSRRRAACIIKRVKMDMLVTEDEITLAEAQELSRAIQTAKEHSVREKGMRYLAMASSGLSQEAISKIENISQTSVSRAIQAASVADGLIELFPDLNELNHSDYKYLLTISEDQQSPEQLDELTAQLKLQKEDEEATRGVSLEKDEILKLIKKHIALKSKGESRGPTFEPIVKFEDRRVTAKVKLNKEKRTVSYEFKRLPQNIQNRIDSAIQDILSEVASK